MSPLYRQRGLRGWVVVVSFVWLAAGIGLSQATSAPAKDEGAAEKSQKAPTTRPTSQPAASQPATAAVDKYWELQQRAQRLSEKGSPQEGARSKPARQPGGDRAVRDRARARRLEELRRRARESAQRARAQAESRSSGGAPRGVQPQERGRSVQPSTRGRDVRLPAEGGGGAPAASRPSGSISRVSPAAQASRRAGGAERAGPSASGEARTEWFSFEGIPWEDVIAQIAERVGKPLMTEDVNLMAIGGELTYKSSRKFTQQEAIDELQFLLYDRGYYFLETENYIYVVPVSDVERRLPLKYVYPSLEAFERANPRDMQFVIVYLDMGNEQDANELVNAFSGFFEAVNVPIVPKGTNKVKITALARDVRKFLALRAMIKVDKQDIRRTKVYKFKTNVRIIERILRDMLGLQQPRQRYDARQRRWISERGQESPIRITADERTNTLIVRAKPEDFKEIDSFLEDTRLDEIADIGEFKTRVIEIEHGNAAEIANLLNQIFQQEQGQQAPRVRVTPRTPQRRSSSRGRSSRTRTPQPQQPVPQDIIVEDIYERAKKTVRIFPDERTNTIIVYANEEGFQRVQEMLETIDQPVPSNFRTFKLVHAEAEQIQPIVEQVARGAGTTARRGRAARPASVVVDATNNALHVIAGREDMSRIEAIIKELDVEGAKENRHVIELENLAPSRVAQIVMPLLGGGGRPGPRRPGRRGVSARTSATPQVIPLDEAGLLIVHCSDEDWTKIEETIRLWDSNAVSNTPETKAYKIAHGNVQSIFNTLIMLYRSYTHPTLGRSQVLIAQEEETIYVQAIKPAQEEIEALIKSMDVESAGRPLVIIPLEHAEASQVAQIAQGLLPPGSNRRGRRFGPGGGVGASLQAEPITNSLIIQADAKTVERVKEFAAEMDAKVAAQQPERKYYTLKNATPREVVSAITQLFGATGGSRRGRPVGTQVKTVIVGSQVVVDAPSIKQAEIAALIQELDNLSDRGITTMLVQMPGADVRSIARKLYEAFRDRVRSQGVVAQFSDDASTETILVTVSKDVADEANKLLEQYKEYSKGLINQTEFYQLQHANANEVANWLRTELVTLMQKQFGRSAAQQVKVTPDNRTNRVIISAPQVAVAAAKPLLEQYDVPQKELQVESLLVTETRKLPGLDVANLANQLNKAFGQEKRADKLKTTFGFDRLTEMLIITTPKDTIGRVEELITKFAAETEDLVPVQKFVQIQNADANYIASQIRSLLTTQIGRKRGSNVARRLNITVDTRLNRLILDAPKFAIPMAEALIAELDQPPTTESQLRTIPLANADANTVLGVLRTIFIEKIRARTLQISVEPLTNSLIVGAAKEDFEDIQKWATELDDKAKDAVAEQRIFELENANPWEVNGVLQQTFVQKRRGVRIPPGKEVKVAIIAGRSIFVTAPPEKMADIEALITTLDQVGRNELVIKQYPMPGLGTQLNQFARQIETAVNRNRQGREPPISITAVPAADTLIVTALERRLPDIEKYMQEFKGLYKPHKMETIALVNGDANTIYQALSRVLQQKIRAGKIQLSVEGMTNSLIVSAAEEDLAELREWAAKFDLAAAEAITKPRMFELKNASPWEVRSILTSTFIPRGTSRRRRGVDISFDILGGRTIVAKAPADKMTQIEELISELDSVLGNKAKVQIYNVAGMGSRLTQFARDIQNAVNTQVQARDRRISVTALPAADVLVVTAMEDQFELIQQAMEQFKGIYKPMRIETIALQNADANMVYQALSRVLQPKIRAGKIQLSVEPMTNSLIVNAAEEELAEIREWAASYDAKAEELASPPKIIKLKNANPWEVRGILTTTFVQRGGRARGGGKDVRVEVMGGSSLVVYAPADKMEEIETLVAQLEEIGSNKAEVRTFEVRGMGSRLSEFARQIERAVNTQVEARERRISVGAYPAADVLIVTALPDQFDMIQQAMDKFKDLYEPGRIETIALKNGDAQTVYNSLRNVLQQKLRAGKVQISVEPMTNSLIVFAAEEDLTEIREWTAKFDEAAANAVSPPQIFELENANPWEVRNVLNTTYLSGGRGRRQAGKEVRFDVIGGRSVVVMAPSEKMKEIEELIRKLDEVGGNKTVVRTYVMAGLGNRLNELARQVRDAVNVGMQARERRISVTAYPPADALIVTALEEQFPRVEAMMEEFKPLLEVGKFATEFFKLEYVDAAQIVRPVRDLVITKARTSGKSSRGTQDFSVTSDPRTNRLIVFAPESIMPEVREMVKQLDIEVEEDNVVTIELKYADPWEVRNMLNDIFSRGNRRNQAQNEQVYVTVSNNTLVVKAPPKKLEQINELIDRIDAEDKTGLQIKIYDLKVLNATLVAGQVQMYLRGIMPVQRRGRMQPGAFAEPTTNTLVVMAPPQHLPFIDGLVAELESKTGKTSEPRLYVLKYARAEQIQQNIDAMLKAKVAEREGNVRKATVQTAVFADPTGNRLFVYAPEEYQELAAQLIEMIDEDVDTGQIVHILPLEQADATQLAQTLNQTVQSFVRGGRGGGGQQVRITADVGSNSILVSGLPKDVAEVEDLIKELEINSTQVPELQIFQLENANSADVADALNGAFGGMGRGGRRGGNPAERVTVTADDYYNRLIVTANKRVMRQVEAFVAQLDAEPAEGAEPNTLPGGKKLYFVDVFRGDPLDIAYDVQSMLPPEEEGGPSVEASWFGEYITVKCRPSEFPAIEDLIRQFERRAKVETVIVSRKPKGNLDELLQYIQQLDGVPVQLEGPAERPRRASIVEELWEEGEEPPNYKRNRPQNRQVNEDVRPYLLAPTLLPAWLQEAAEGAAQEAAQDRPQDTTPGAAAPQRDKQAPPAKPPAATRARGAADDQRPQQRQPVRVQVLPDGRIVLRGPKSQVEDIEEALDLLEEGVGIGEVIRIFRFKYGDVNAAAQILDRMFNERQMIRIQPPQQQQQRGRQGQQGQQGRGQQQGLMEQLRGMVGGGRQAGGRTTTRGGQRVRIATDPGHSYLIVKCDESDLPEIRQLLRELDIPPGEVNIKVFQLKNLDASETAQNIKDILGITKAQGRRNPFAGMTRGRGRGQQQLMQMLQQQLVSISGVEGGGAKVESVEIVPNAVTNSLMVSAPPEVMTIIENVINELEGLEGGTIIVIRHYPLERAKVDDVLPLLQEVFAGATGGGGRGPRGGRARSPGALGPVTISGDPRVNTIIYTCEAKDVEIVEKQIEMLDLEGVINEAETYACQWGDAQAIAGVVEAIYAAGPRGRPQRPGRGAPGRSGTEVRIVAEPATNTIIVWGPLDKRDIILTQIQELDQRSKQSFREIAVQYANAEELAGKLMQMFGGRAGAAVGRRPGRRGPRGGGVQGVGGRVVILGDDNAKKLLVRAPEKLFEEIVELAAMLDQPSQELQVRRFELAHAKAEAVVDQVKQGLMEYIQLTRAAGKDFDFDAFTAMADPRTNSVVVVGSEETFLFVQNLLAVTDLPTPPDRQRVFRIFTLDRADAETVAQAINSLSATGGGAMGGGRGPRGGRRGMPRGMRGGAAPAAGELNVMASAEPVTNAVMVYGTEEDIAVVEKSIIQPFEQISEEGKPFFVKLQYARAENVAQTLDEFFRNRGGRGRGRGAGGQRLSDQVSFSADPDTNTLIVLASGSNRAFVEELIKSLDQEEGGREIKLFQLQFADANSAAQVITTTFEEQRRGRGGRAGAVADADRVIATPDVPSNTIVVRANAANMKKVESLINELEDTIAVTYDPVEIQLQNAQASQVASFIWQFLGEAPGEGGRRGRGGRGGAAGVRRGPQIIPNDNANTLIVRGSEAEVERIRMLALRFDDPEIVATKVKIIEVPLGQDAVSLGAEVERIVNDAEQLDAEQTGRRPRLVVIGTDDYTNTLIVGGNPAQFGMVDTIVQQLASIRPEGTVTRILEFKNLSAENAVEVINYLQERRGGSSRGSMRRGGRGTPSRRRPSGTGGSRRRSRRQRSMLWSPPLHPSSSDIQPAAYGEPFIGTLVVTPALAQTADDPQDPDQDQEQAAPARRGQGARQKRQPPRPTRPPQSAPAAERPGAALQLPGVSGALRGDVTATPLDSRRIVITGDPRDVDFLEQLLLAMEIDAPVPVIEVFTLESAKATALAPILTETIGNMIRTRTRSPGPADQFSINAEARSNSLIVSATEANMAMIEEMINKLDTATEKDTQFKAVPLEYMRAVEAVAQLTPVIERLNKIRDVPANAQASIDAIDRSNAVLIVGTPSDITEIESLISAIDIEISPDEERFGAFSEMVIVGLKNGDAQEIAKVLTDMIEAEQEAARQAAGGGKPGAPVVRKLRLTSPDGEVLAEIDLEKPIRLIPEKGTNSLIIFSTPKNNESIQELVGVFDTLPVGAEIDVKSFALQYGNAEQVAELLQRIFEEGKAALVRPVKGDAKAQEKGVLPPVPPGLAAQGLPYNVTITHDVRSNTVFVIGRKDAVLLAAGLINELDRPSGELAFQPRVLTFKNLQASDLEQKLNDMLDKRLNALGDKGNAARDSAIIFPFDRSNSLVVLATDDVFKMIEDLTVRLDDAQMYRVVDTRYRRLEYADAQKLQGMLQEVFDRKQDAESKTKAESKDILYVTADARSNSLMLTGTRDYLAEAEALVNELDRQFDPTVEFKIRQVKLNSAANIATLLQEMIDKSLNQGDSKLTGTPIHIAADPLSDSLLLAASHEDMVLIERWVELLDRPSELGRMLAIVPLTRANAEDLSKAVQDVFKNKAKEDVGDFTVTFDPTTNSVVAIGPPALVQDVEDFIRRLDETKALRGSVVKIFKLEQADAEDAGQLLRNILEGRGGSVGGGSSRGGSRQEAAEQIMLVYQREHPELGVETMKAMTKDIVVIDDLRTNSLVIEAPPGGMALMESLVAAIDVPPDAAKIRVFALRNADAAEMVKMLEKLFEETKQGGSRGGGGGDEQQRQLVIGEGLAQGGRQTLTFTTDARTNSVIAAGTTGYLDLVEELIINLDRVELEERKTMVYAPRNIPADVLATSIREFSDQEQQRLQDLGEEISTQRRMEREIGAIANEDSNRMILSVHPRMESEVLDIVRELDQPPPQVMIQVLILEVTTEDNLELGIEFAFQDLQYTKAGTNDTTTFDFVGGTDIGAAGTGLGGFTFTVTGRDFNFLLRALQAQSSLRVLSRPQIVAMDNQEASIDIVTRVPVVTSSTTTFGGQLQVSTDYQDAGIRLTVTPQINPDGFVRMEIEQEVSDFTGSTVSVGAGVTLPILFERKANTTVTVKDNETVVLGGLITSKDDYTEQKIPILGDIPGLGVLFRNQKDTVTRTELLIVLTPRVLRSIEDYHDASVEVRDETGTLPYDVLTNPLMKGLRIEPQEQVPPSDEELLGPFPQEESAGDADERPDDESTYGPPTPASSRPDNTGAEIDPNSYDVPITRRS